MFFFFVLDGPRSKNLKSEYFDAGVVFTNKRSQAKVYKMYFGISSV